VRMMMKIRIQPRGCTDAGTRNRGKHCSVVNAVLLRPLAYKDSRCS
jgi:hypothetical protein